MKKNPIRLEERALIMERENYGGSTRQIIYNLTHIHIQQTKYTGPTRANQRVFKLPWFFYFGVTLF